MKLILTDDDGALLDTTEITKEDWDKAQTYPWFAAGILQSLQAGKDAI